MRTMLSWINAERANVGVAPLCFNAKLNTAALKHSNDMKKNLYFSHTGYDGSELGGRVRKANYVYDTVGGKFVVKYNVSR